MTTDELPAADAESLDAAPAPLDPADDITAPDAASGEEPSSPEERIAWLQLALQSAQDQHLRLLAEFDNFRRRTGRERLEARELFTAEVWKRIVGVIDDLQRGLASSASGEDFRRGVEIALSRIRVQMASDHIERVSCIGEPFDPRRHIAIVEQPTSDPSEDGIVLNESCPAYVMGARVLRPADVIVGRLTPPESATD